MFEGIFQPMHLILILIIALIIFGPGKLPELGAGLGKAIREFKKAMRDVQKEAEVLPEPKETPKKTQKQITTPTTMGMKQETAENVTVDAESTDKTIS